MQARLPVTSVRSAGRSSYLPATRLPRRTRSSRRATRFNDSATWERSRRQRQNSRRRSIVSVGMTTHTSGLRRQRFTREKMTSRSSRSGDPCGAKLLARSGSVETAVALGHEALELVDRTECLNRRAKVQLDLAEMLRFAGRATESAVEGQEAIALYLEKGNTAAAQQARVLVLAGADVRDGRPLTGPLIGIVSTRPWAAVAG